MPSAEVHLFDVYLNTSMTYENGSLPTFVGLEGGGYSLYCSRGAQFASAPKNRPVPSTGELVQTKPVMKIRYSERVQTKFPVIFAGDSFVGEGTVNNVSVPGCAIVSDRTVEPGAYLEMKVLLPDNAPSLSVELAKIRWRKGRRFGVEFIRMPGADQVRLGRLIKRRGAVKSSARLAQPPVLHLR